MTCSVEGCDGKTVGRGYCGKHYQRWLRRGDALAPYITRWTGNEAELDVVQFVKYREIDPITGCWAWTGATFPNGYGQLRGRPTRMVHRVSFEHFVGRIPEDFLVCHTCDNPPCFNPRHLFVGTGKDNAQDALSKDRIPLGVKRPNTKLKAEQIPKIREMLAIGFSPYKIAPIFECSPATIRDIETGRNWKHV